MKPTVTYLNAVRLLILTSQLCQALGKWLNSCNVPSFTDCGALTGTTQSIQQLCQSHSPLPYSWAAVRAVSDGPRVYARRPYFPNRLALVLSASATMQTHNKGSAI